MAIITKISVQKKQADRYNVFLDDQYAFSVDEDVLIRYGLKKGQKLSELDITQIQYEDEIRKAYNDGIQYLSYRMRSIGEIEEHLLKKEWSPSVIQVVLQKLQDQKYTNDLEFAKAYVRTHISAGKKGPIVLRQELAQKRVKEAYIEEALQEYKEELQIEHAIILGNKHAVKNKKLSERLLKQKLEQFLATKGFPFHVISIALEEIHYEKDEDEEWESLVKQADKFHRKYKDSPTFEYEQKMKQSLYRKGFGLELIQRYIDEKTTG